MSKEYIEQFTSAFNQAPSSELGDDLIREESRELAIALTFEPDEAILKEMADLVYVLYWKAWAMGWDLDEALYRVHQSNMSKLGDDGKPIYNEQGKVLKGPDYKAPSLEDLVDREES